MGGQWKIKELRKVWSHITSLLFTVVKQDKLLVTTRVIRLPSVGPVSSIST